MSDANLFGQLDYLDPNDEFNAIAFMIRQALGHVRTGIPVKIVAVHGGGVGAPATVDVQPLVKQMDGAGNVSSHGVVKGIPAARNHSGSGTIINDPVVGDVYLMHVADRDISALKNSGGAESPPGSFRRHGLSDGVLGDAIVNPGTPKQYVQFLPGGGVKVVDSFGNKIITSAGKITINPKDLTGIVYLGGDGVTGTYDFVTTLSGASVNVKARIS